MSNDLVSSASAGLFRADSLCCSAVFLAAGKGAVDYLKFEMSGTYSTGYPFCPFQFLHPLTGFAFDDAWQATTTRGRLRRHRRNIQVATFHLLNHGSIYSPQHW